MVFIALITLGVSGWSAYSNWNAKQIVEGQQQTLLPATANSEALLSALVNQESGERGYLITQQPSYLGPYRQGQDQEADLVVRLQQELAGQPDLVGELRSVEELHHTWVTQVAEPEIADIRSGNVAAAVAAESTDAGQHDFENLRSAVDTLSAAIRAQSAASDASVDSALDRTFYLAILRAAAVIAVLALVWLLIRRWVNDPIEQLASEVRTVAGGELDRRVEVQGPPEIASLGRDIEAMRQRLRDETDELRQIRQTLAEHSPLHLLLSSQLEPSGNTSYFAVAGRLMSAEGVLAGDWYDAWEMDGPRMALAVVDISGHGPAAGLFALTMKHLLSPPLRAGMAPGAALAWAADECGETDEQFATAIVVDLDLATGLLRYANAGHPEGLVVRAGGIERLPPTGPLMCALPGSWGTGQLAVTEGDLLVLITDGVVEARLPDGSELGMDRVIEVVAEQGQRAEPDVVAEAVISAVREAAVLPLRDDATVVAVRVGPA